MSNDFSYILDELNKNGIHLKSISKETRLFLRRDRVTWIRVFFPSISNSKVKMCWRWILVKKNVYPSLSLNFFCCQVFHLGKICVTFVHSCKNISRWSFAQSTPIRLFFILTRAMDN